MKGTIEPLINGCLSRTIDADETTQSHQVQTLSDPGSRNSVARDPGNVLRGLQLLLELASFRLRGAWNVALLLRSEEGSPRLEREPSRTVSGAFAGPAKGLQTSRPCLPILLRS